MQEHLEVKMNGLTWLHLSDWHQRENEFDRQVVLGALLKDIQERAEISPDLEKIDFVIFSGDVAYSGKSEEYRTAKEQLFQPLIEACELNPSQLFIVPGNHDLDMDVFRFYPRYLSKPLTSEAEIQSWLMDNSRRSQLFEPFRAFVHFVKDCTSQEGPDYANVRRWQIGGKKIAVLGLNSAWMCGRNKNADGMINDKGFVLVGEPQIQNYIEEIADADIKIAVLHHPFDWLAEFDLNQVERRLMQQCDFILFGHQHRPHVTLTQSPSISDCVIIPAGACYNRRIPNNNVYANSYNFVHLDFDTGRCVVFLRRWNDSRNEWIEDIDSSQGGKFEFRLTRIGTEKEKRAIQIRDKLVDLYSKGMVPVSIFSNALQILEQKPEQLNDEDRRRDEILDMLLRRDSNVASFIEAWYSLLINRLSFVNLSLIKVELNQIRCFDKLAISFQTGRKSKARQWTMVLGDNATGKTTLLRCIAIGLCNESDGATLMRKMPGGFIRKGAQKGIIKLTLIDDNSKKKYVVTTTITKMPDSRSEILRKDTMPVEGFPWNDIFVCGYGTQRSTVASASYDGYSPLYALSTLFDPNASLQNPEVVLLKAKDSYEMLRKALLSVLMLDEFNKDLTLPEKPDDSVEVGGPWGKVPLDSLSEGYRSTSQWLLDFLGWAIYAGRLRGEKVIGGILLIDELEQHLHPRWQRYIVQRLVEQLPQTQVISTTHTPLVASGVSDVDSSALLKLYQNPEKKSVEAQLIDPADLRGKRADQILAELFGLVTSRSPGSQGDIARYAELQSKDRSPEEDQELDDLSNKLQETLVFGENAYEQDVERAVHQALEERLNASPSKLVSFEIKRQLRNLFRE